MPTAASPYQILDVSNWLATKVETLGTKAKDWLVNDDDERWLFKYVRGASGDDWSEKAAAELASLVGLPHAVVDMAQRSGSFGALSLDLTRVEGKRRWSLVTGNQLLWVVDREYPRDRFRGVQDYTVHRVLDILARLQLAPTIMDDGTRLSAPEVFVGDLLFDTWIGNQDRHHENWGILVPVHATSGDQAHLAPSYDHASCLGQTLTDERRIHRLNVHDLGHITHWVRKARGALYGGERDDKPLPTLEAFEAAAQMYPDGAAYWLDRLSAVPDEVSVEILARIPDRRITPCARVFAAEMLRLNRRALLDSAAP